MDKKTLSERDICTKFITPAIAAGGWSTDIQMREEVNHKPGMPIAVVELKDNNHCASDRNAHRRDV